MTAPFASGNTAFVDAPQLITKVSIIVSKGSLEGIYPGLIMANGARMEGIEVNLFFTFFGMDAPAAIQPAQISRMGFWVATGSVGPATIPVGGRQRLWQRHQPSRHQHAVH